MRWRFLILAMLLLTTTKVLRAQSGSSCSDAIPFVLERPFVQEETELWYYVQLTEEERGKECVLTLSTTHTETITITADVYTTCDNKLFDATTVLAPGQTKTQTLQAGLVNNVLDNYGGRAYLKLHISSGKIDFQVEVRVPESETEDPLCLEAFEVVNNPANGQNDTTKYNLAADQPTWFSFTSEGNQTVDLYFEPTSPDDQYSEKTVELYFDCASDAQYVRTGTADTVIRGYVIPAGTYYAKFTGTANGKATFVVRDVNLPCVDAVTMEHGMTYTTAAGDNWYRFYTDYTTELPIENTGTTDVNIVLYEGVCGGEQTDMGWRQLENVTIAAGTSYLFDNLAANALGHAYYLKVTGATTLSVGGGNSCETAMWLVDGGVYELQPGQTYWYKYEFDGKSEIKATFTGDNPTTTKYIGGYLDCESAAVFSTSFTKDVVDEGIVLPEGLYYGSIRVDAACTMTIDIYTSSVDKDCAYATELDYGDMAIAAGWYDFVGDGDLTILAEAENTRISAIYRMICGSTAPNHQIEVMTDIELSSNEMLHIPLEPLRPGWHYYVVLESGVFSVINGDNCSRALYIEPGKPYRMHAGQSVWYTYTFNGREKMSVTYTPDEAGAVVNKEAVLYFNCGEEPAYTGTSTAETISRDYVIPAGTYYAKLTADKDGVAVFTVEEVNEACAVADTIGSTAAPYATDITVNGEKWFYFEPNPGIDLTLEVVSGTPVVSLYKGVCNVGTASDYNYWEAVFEDQTMAANDSYDLQQDPNLPYGGYYFKVENGTIRFTTLTYGGRTCEDAYEITVGEEYEVADVTWFVLTTDGTKSFRADFTPMLEGEVVTKEVALFFDCADTEPIATRTSTTDHVELDYVVPAGTYYLRLTTTASTNNAGTIVFSYGEDIPCAVAEDIVLGQTYTEAEGTAWYKIADDVTPLLYVETNAEVRVYKGICSSTTENRNYWMAVDTIRHEAKVEVLDELLFDNLNIGEYYFEVVAQANDTVRFTSYVASVERRDTVCVGEQVTIGTEIYTIDHDMTICDTVEYVYTARPEFTLDSLYIYHFTTYRSPEVPELQMWPTAVCGDTLHLEEASEAAWQLLTASITPEQSAPAEAWWEVLDVSGNAYSRYDGEKTAPGVEKITVRYAVKTLCEETVYSEGKALTVGLPNADNFAEYDNIPAVSKYDWLLMLNVKQLQEQGYEFTEEDVTWYRVVGTKDLLGSDDSDDELLGKGYYYTVGETLVGTGDYYATVDLQPNASEAMCGGILRTQVFSFVSTGKEGVAIYPNMLASGEQVNVTGLPDDTAVEITVYDMMGQVLHRFHTQGQTTYSFATQAVPGYYMVQVRFEEKEQILKYVVK